MPGARWTIAALLVVAAAFAMACLGRKSVHADLVVPARPDRVWAVLTDAAAYEDWNPIFVSAGGEFREGGSVAYQLRSPDGSLSDVEPETTHTAARNQTKKATGAKGKRSYNTVDQEKRN